MPSPLASVEPPVPCAECLTRVSGIRWGDLCPDCRERLRRRASPLARRISLFASLLVILYAWLDVPLTPRNKVWVAAIAVGTYFLARKMATQVLMEFMRRPSGNQPTN
jgi:hypothetical protein